MMNQVIFVGRLAKNVAKGKVQGRDVKQIKVAVPRSFKNAEGIYETDILPVILEGKMAENVLEYCHEGDVVGIKGSMRSYDNNGKLVLYISGEKITFLSSNKNLTKESDDENDD